MVRFLMLLVNLVRMKKRFEKLTLLLLFVLFLTGCKKEFSISDKQGILFQFEYINYAWGYQHHGYFIDNKGSVLTYSNPEEWNFPQTDLTISEEEISENLTKCLDINVSVPQSEILKYSNYIKNIASSKVTALKNVAADAGSSEYICYQFSESTHTYKGYLIKMEGDFTCENLNFYSKKVVTWMKDINKTVAGN